MNSATTTQPRADVQFKLRPREVRHVRRAAAWLSRRCGYNRSDREDLLQDLVLELLEQWQRFDPERSKRITFIKQVVDSKIKDLIRFKNAQKRDFTEEGQSLSELVEDCDGRKVRLAELIGPEDLSRRTRHFPREACDLLDLISDVRHVIETLPDHLREPCQQLLRRNLEDAPHDIPDHVLVGIRSHFERAGLADYLRT